MASPANYRRVAVYNGNRWEMDDIDPDTFLNEALVGSFPDLRGARFSVEQDDSRQEVRFTYAKVSGTKGA